MSGQFLARVGLALVAFVLMLAVPRGAAWSEPAQLLIQGAGDLEAYEDPQTLLAQGKLLLEAGQTELARATFDAAIKVDELNHYAAYHGSPYGDAVLLELMGELEASRALWREQLKVDLVTTLHRLRALSRDPRVEELVAEGEQRARALVEQVKKGEEPQIYTTRKGAPRHLKAMSQEEALEALGRGEALRYVYIESLDLTGKTFTREVACTRCVFGEVRGYNSEYQEALLLSRALVMGDLHLGKKWKGEVNKSASEAASKARLINLDSSVVLGSLNLDSVQVSGRLMGLPLALVKGHLDMRNISVQGVTELRYVWVGGELNAKGALLQGSNYFGHARFGDVEFSRAVVKQSPLYFNSAEITGEARFERCELLRGATFEGASFGKAASLRQSRVYDRLNFSRATFEGPLSLAQVQATNLDFLGTRVRGQGDFADAIFTGNVRFALDGLTRRLNRENVNPLHKLYKQYQGDDDAEQDLTSRSYYGVTRVDDLTAKLDGDVSFANTIFEKFVNFEGVRFGDAARPEQIANFYNTQFYGEAHFERTTFYALADFRTIFGNEVSFNHANFHGDFVLDDANVPGRLTLSGADLLGDAQISFYGARVASFGATFRQLRRADGEHRLFYERCALAPEYGAELLDDPRLLAASWDPVQEREVTDPAERRRRARDLCGERAIAEFVGLKDSFSKRGMSQETDWAYWHLRHYKNRLGRIQADTFLAQVPWWIEWLVFEKAFGWGVRLPNLLGTGLVVVLFFVLLLRVFCGEMLVDWDNETIPYKDLPPYAMFIVSFHSFLGRARDWKSKSSPAAWKLLYTIEIIFGIILITFFIGAYTRMVLR